MNVHHKSDIMWMRGGPRGGGAKLRSEAMDAEHVYTRLPKSLISEPGESA